MKNRKFYKMIRLMISRKCLKDFKILQTINFGKRQRKNLKKFTKIS